MGPSARRRWSVAGLCCFINFLQMGLNRMPGLLFPAVMQRYNVGRSAAVLPFALCYSLRNLSGPIASLLGKRYGLRCVTLAGSLLSTVAIAVCFFVEDIASFTVFYGGIYGIGYGLGTMVLAEILTENFDKKVSVANGISLGGPCLAGFVLPLVIDSLLSFYGISGTMLVLSGLMFQTVPASLLLWPPQKKNTEHEFVLNTVCQNIDESEVKNSTEIVIDIPRTFSHQPGLYPAVDQKMEVKPRSIAESDVAHQEYYYSKEENGTEKFTSHSIRKFDIYSKDVLSGNINSVFKQKYPNINRKHTNEAHCSNNAQKLYYIEVTNKDIINGDTLPDSNKYQGLTFQNSYQDTKSKRYDLNHDIDHDIKDKKNSRFKFDARKSDFEGTCMQKPNSTERQDFKFQTGRSKKSKDIKMSTDDHGKKTNSNVFGSCSRLGPFAAFFDLAFLLYIFSSSFSVCVFSYIATIVVDFARDCGVRNGLDVSILMSMSITDAVGRFFLGFVTDCGLMTSTQFFALSMAIESAMLFTLILLNSFETILICCTVYGLFHGATCSTVVTLCSDNLEKHQLSMALASRLILNTPIYLLQPVLIGLFREKHGSYKGLIAVLGVVCVVCCMTSAFTPWASTRRKKKNDIRNAT